MLVTLADVKTYLGITDTDDDVVLTLLIDQAGTWFEGQLGGRILEKATFAEEIHDGSDFVDGPRISTAFREALRDIFVKNAPIASSPTIVVERRTGPLSDPNFQAVDGDDFVVYEDEGRLHHFSGWDTGSQRVRITYDGGFATIPDDIQLAVTLLVANLFNKRTSQGIKREAIEGTSIEWADITKAHPIEVQSTVARYRRSTFGRV